MERRRRVPVVARRARSGGARRPARLRLRVGGRTSLPRRVLPLVGAGGVPCCRGRPHVADPARSRHPPGDPELQPSGPHRGGSGDARPHLGRSRRLRYRRRGDPDGVARLRHSRQAQTGDVTRGRRTDRQHDGARPVSRLRIGGLLPAVPQRDPQAPPEAAPTDVDRMHQPRDDQGRRPARSRCAGLQLHRPRRGARLGRHLLRHHQERRVRAARPHGQCQHRARHRLLVARGPGRGHPPGHGRLPVLRVRVRTRSSPTTSDRDGPTSGASSRHDAHRTASTARSPRRWRSATGTRAASDRPPTHNVISGR